MNHFLFMILCKKVNIPTLHHFIRCRLPILLHPSAFEHVCILGSSYLNCNYKDVIAFHLGLYVERNGPHTSCNHAKKLKNVARGWFNKCGLRNFRCISQNNMEFIPLQVCVPPNPNNFLLFIVTKPNQRIVQDLCIHDYMMLMPWGFLLNRWATGFTQLHNHILSNSQMSYQVVFGNASQIAPMILTSKFCIIPCPMYMRINMGTGNQGKGNHIWNQNNKKT
jgi:hypothetical protein